MKLNTKTKDGRELLIRQPNENDAANIIGYSKLVFASTNQVLTMLDEYNISLENEVLWIQHFTQNENALLLIAELENQIAGLLFFAPNTKKKNSHTGEFGVSVHPEFQGIGIGRILIERLLEWAKSNTQIEKVYLNVFHTNHPAIKLYKSIGFIEEGRQFKAVKQPSGEYVDVIQMCIFTR